MDAAGASQDYATDTTSGDAAQTLNMDGLLGADCDAHGTYVVTCVMDVNDKLFAIHWQE